MTEMEVHIQQTNDRLLCIQQQLSMPGETFQSAARELLEWCSDMRAFQPHFEQRLFGCLMVVNEVSAQPGYDLDLGYRLLALCAAHSDKFTSKSAGVLSSWCEELGRLVLVRHQKTQSGSVDCPPPGPGGPTGAAAALQKPLGGLIDGGAGIQWQQQPQHQQPIPPVGLHDPMSVATPGWATGAGSSPAGTVAHLPGGQGLLPSAVLPGVGGYTSSQQRPLHTGGGPSAAAGMGPSGYHRGPPGAVMFPDGSAAVSAPSSGAKYGTYAGGGGVRQPGAVAGAVFNQHGMCPTGHDLVAGQMPVVSSVTPGQGPSQIEDQTQQQQICQPRSDGHVGGPAGAAITGNQGGHCQSQQMASMQSVYGMPYNPQQSPYTATNRLAAVSGGPMGPSGVQTAAHVMPPAAQQGSAVAAAGMSQLPVPGGNLVQGSVGLLPADDPMVVGASGGVPGGTLKSSGPVKGAVGVGGNGGAGAVFVGHQQQRPAPYPNPQQYMQSKRAQFVNGQVPPSEAMYSMGQQFTGQTYGPWAAGGGRPGTHLSPNYPVGQPRQNQAAAGGYCGSVVNVSGGQNGGNGYMIPAGSCRSGAYNTQLMAGQTGYPNPMYAGGQHMSPVLPANQSSSKMAAMAAAAASGNVPQQPYNCMPSLPPSYMNPGGVPPSYPTIAAGISPSYGSHTMSEDPKPVIMNGKIEGGMPPTAMRIKKEEVNDDLRLTFPVRDGVVLPPFRLEHNLSVSNHVFHLRESVYQTLIYRPDLELQLKCFHHEDRQMATNWPMSVSISVNSTLLSIDRSADGVASHRPLYLKSVCQPGRNTIQITVSACCCSHLFFLTLVHRPSVKSVLQGLLRKRLLPAEHCVTKIKRSFVQPGVSSAVMGGGAGMSGECDEQTIKLSLKCPITYRTIALPARGHDCKHIQCFDLESYLQVNCERSIWRCPICNKSALLEGLEIDQYLWGILNNLSGTEFEEVTLDPSASWKPVPAKTIRDDDTSMKRWNKAISPSSMNLPTMTSWQDSSSFVRNQSSAASRPNQALQGPLPTQLQPQQQQPFFQGGASVNQYDRGQGPSPSFSPIGTPDFLSTLTHAGDNLLHGNVDVKGSGCPSQSDVPIRQPRTPVDGQMVTGSTHTRVPVDGQSIHPCTPLDGQLCGNPRTPLDGQMGHPRTPLDSSQLRTPVDGQLLHPRTPLDGHMLGHPITPIDGQTVNPRTPVDGSMLASCPRTPVDGHHFHATDSGCGSDVSSVRPMPGTPGSNPRTPASGGSRTYSAAVAVVAVSSASAAAATVNGSSSRSGSSTSCSSSVNSNSSTNNNNIINGCSNDASQQPNSRAPSAGDSASLLGVDFNFDATAFVDSEGHGHKTLDLLQEEIDDPTELLSYLGPSADNSGGAACSSNADDLLSLFT